MPLNMLSLFKYVENILYLMFFNRQLFTWKLSCLHHIVSSDLRGLYPLHRSVSIDRDFVLDVKPLNIPLGIYL